MAFSVRAATIGYGLPFSYQEQEQRIVNIALKMGATGDLDPHLITKGVLWYILLAEYGVYYMTGRAFGLFQNSFDFAKSYFVDHTPFYVIDRLNQLVLALLSLWFLYKLAVRLKGQNFGLWALAMGSVVTYHVEASRYAFVDILNALFGVLYLFHLYSYVESGRVKSLLWSAVFTGLSCSSKLHGGILLVGLVGLTMSQKEFGRSALAVAVFGAIFVLTTPALILSPAWSYRALMEEMQIRYIVEQKALTLGGFAEMLKMLVLTGLSLPGVFLCLIGLAAPVGPPRFKWLGMILPSVLYLFWVGRQPAFHYLLVIWPALTLLMAAGVACCADRARPFLSKIVLALGFLVILSHLFYLPGSLAIGAAVPQTRMYLQPVPAHQMIGWIRQNIPRGSRLGVMAGGTWKGRLFPVPEQIHERIEKFENLPREFALDYSRDNDRMYQWILRIVESDTTVPAFHITNLDVRTREEQDLAPRRTNLVWVEDILPFESWKDFDRLGFDCFLYVDGMDMPDGRISKIHDRLKSHEPLAAFPPFYLYRLAAPR